MGPILLPVLKALGSYIGGTLKGVFEQIKGVILIVSGVLTGDFSKAWEGVKLVAIGTLRRIAAVYNNTLGRIPKFAKIDMDKVEEALLGVDEAAEDTGEALTDTGRGRKSGGGGCKESRRGSIASRGSGGGRKEKGSRRPRQ